jgi:hypothetical protein
LLSAVLAQVRIAACAALVAFAQSSGSSYCATNSGYLAAGVVLHMDDSDTQVAEAACQVGAWGSGRVLVLAHIYYSFARIPEFCLRIPACVAAFQKV